MSAFFLFAYLMPLGAPDLVDPDESRYCEISREMIANGEWWSPRLAGVRYFEKPPLGYWAIAGSMSLFGMNAFAARIPSALAVGLTALLVFALARRARSSEDGSLSPALIAVLVSISCLEVWILGNAVALDSLFTLFLTGAIAAFFLASESGSGTAQERLYSLLAGLSCAAAFMTKGFLALVIPILVLTPYLLWERRPRDLFRLSWLPILTAAIAVLPFALLIHRREPDFWHQFFWNEHVRRFLADNAQHARPFWYFALVGPGVIFPWTFLAPCAIRGTRDSLREGGRPGRLARLCLCWLLFPFLFFSASRGKLLTYILPCIPPFAILMGIGLDRRLIAPRPPALSRGMAATAGVIAIALLGLVYLQFIGPPEDRPFRGIAKSIPLLMGLSSWIAGCLLAARSAGMKCVLRFGWAPILTLCLVHYCIPDRFIAVKVPEPFLREYAHDLDERIVISDKDLTRAACWWLEREDIYILGPPGEFRYGFERGDGAGRHLDVDAAARLIEGNLGRIVLLCRLKMLRRIGDSLPEPIRRVDTGPGGYALWVY